MKDRSYFFYINELSLVLNGNFLDICSVIDSLLNLFVQNPFYPLVPSHVTIDIKHTHDI